MRYLSLQQPYQECVNLECLLKDAFRRLKQARAEALLPSEEQDVLLVGSGFSAVLARHALQSALPMRAVFDPSAALEPDMLGGVEALPFEALEGRSAGILLLAAAPANAAGLMRRVDGITGRFAHKVLLFSQDDAQNAIEPPDNDGWLRLNMSYRCVNFAVNLSRRYRPIPLDGKPAGIAIMGKSLAGLLARMGLVKFGCGFAGFVEAAQNASGAREGALAQGCDLLVAHAPHTFAGREREMCAGLACRSAQFLFRPADAGIGAAERDGFTGLRLLGAGEEGMVFEAVSPAGEPVCYKSYHEPRDRSSLLAWTASLADAAPCLSWMAEVRGVPDAGAAQGVVSPGLELAHIPFMDETRDEVLRSVAAYCLQTQAEHVSRGRIPATMPGGIHAMCGRDGGLRFVDVGNIPPLLADGSLGELKNAVIKGLAGLAHETLFCGRSWKIGNPADYAQAVAARLEQDGLSLPSWYLDLLREVLALDAARFADLRTYRELQQRHGLTRPVLPAEVAARAFSPALGVPPAPTVTLGGKIWFRECVYQTFLYRAGEVEPFGPTGEKYGLIREVFEREVRGAEYLDIGSNLGFFLAKASLSGARRCTGIEKNLDLQVQSRRMFAAVNLSNVDVCAMRVANGNPLPGHDVITALAIIHHLYLIDGSFPQLGDLVEYFARAARKSLIIEYVHNPGYRERAQAAHGRDFGDYSEEGLARELARRFSRVEKLADVSDTRAVYFASRS